MKNRSEISIQRDPQRGYRLRAEMVVDLPCQQVFDVFSDAMKLEEITPPWLDFSVLTPQPISLEEGALIDYRLKIHGIPVRWRTEICNWQPPFRFADQQLWGPYKRWFHEHTFKDLGNGTTLVGDDVHYIPRGGGIIHELFVRRDLEKIFRFRQDKLREIFAEMKARRSGNARPTAALLSLTTDSELDSAREFHPRQDRPVQTW